MSIEGEMNLPKQMSAANIDTLYLCCLFLLVAASMGIFFWQLGSIPFLSLNEARRAVPIKEMFQGGDWLLPSLNSELYIDKPPLFYWVGCLFAHAVDTVNEWVVRMPSAVSALITVWVSYFVVRGFAGRWYALTVALVLMTCINFASFARRAEIEMMLTMLCSASLICAYHYILGSGKRYFILASYTLLGMAIICKGPIALLFVTLPVMVFGFRNSRARSYLCNVSGWIVLLALGCFWYVLVAARLGVEIWGPVYDVDIAGKVVGGKSDPFYYYILSVLQDFIPWSLIFIVTPRNAIRAWVRNPHTRFFLLAFLVPLICLSLFSNKHAKYLLPAYPAFAILMGVFLARFYSGLGLHGKRSIQALVLLVPCLHLVYFSFIEGRVFAYRFDAFPKVERILQQYKGVPVVAYDQIDMRMVYYHDDSIPVLNKSEIELLSGKGPVLVMVEKESRADVLVEQGWQPVAAINPYIKNNRTAVLIGNSAFFHQGLSVGAGGSIPN